MDLHIPKRRHRELIGRGGSIVRRIEQDTGAKVNIPNRNVNSNIVTLKGSKEQIEGARVAISLILNTEVSDKPLETRYLDIPVDKFRVLVGKGGSTLERIQRETSCSISVPRKTDKQKLVRLQGSESALNTCKAHIATLLEESYEFVEGPPEEKKKETKNNNNNNKKKAAPAVDHSDKDSRPVSEKTKKFVWGSQPKEHWQNFFVPKKFHKLLIGRGGETIKKLQATSSTRIQVPRKEDVNPAIQVYGTSAQIEAASDAITEVLGFEPQPAPATKASLKHSRKKTDDVDLTNCKKLYIPRSCYFELIGPGGETVREIEETEHVKIKIPHKGAKDNAVRVYGSAKEIKEAIEEIEEVLGFAPSEEPIKTHFVTIGKKHHHKIIGEGGQNLLKLESDSDCNIIVPRKNAKDQRIIVEGNDKCIAKAVKLIKELVGDKDFSDKAASDKEEEELNTRLVNEDEKELAPKPTKAEIASLKKAAAKLWDLDHGRLDIDKDFFVNVQRAVAVYHTRDGANEHFFDHIDDDSFLSPTFRALFNLLDNYEPATGKAEVVTMEEKKENWRFIHTVCNTPVMRYAHAWCVGRGLCPQSESAWKKMLYNAWFNMYSRGTRNDTSGFEHVFVGEFKKGAVTGFHNWLQFYREEKANKVDYRGYVVPHRRGKPVVKMEGDEHILSMKFAWDGEEKPVSTFLLGVTPEFEFALYSMCFFNRDEKNFLNLGGVNVEVTSYRIRSKYGDKIGTAFPTAK